MDWEGCAPLPFFFFQGGSLMNTVSTVGQTMTTDGLTYKKNAVANQNGLSVSSVSAKSSPQNEILIAQTGQEVAENIVKTEADIKAEAQDLQKLSDLVMGPKLRFNVNNELGSVIVKIVDPTTDQVIKEIPSEDIQHLKVRIRKAIGLLFDEMI